jgi:hypothetical protein
VFVTAPTQPEPQAHSLPGPGPKNGQLPLPLGGGIAAFVALVGTLVATGRPKRLKRRCLCPELRAKVAAQQDVVARLERRIENLTSELKALLARCTAEASYLRELHSDIARANDYLRRASREMAKWQANKAQWQERVGVLQQRIARLQQLLAGQNPPAIPANKLKTSSKPVPGWIQVGPSLWAADQATAAAARQAAALLSRPPDWKVTVYLELLKAQRLLQEATAAIAHATAALTEWNNTVVAAIKFLLTVPQIERQVADQLRKDREEYGQATDAELPLLRKALAQEKAKLEDLRAKYNECTKHYTDGTEPCPDHGPAVLVEDGPESVSVQGGALPPIPPLTGGGPDAPNEGPPALDPAFKFERAYLSEQKRGDEKKPAQPPPPPAPKEPTPPPPPTAEDQQPNEQRQEAERKYAKDVEDYNKAKADYDKKYGTPAKHSGSSSSPSPDKGPERPKPPAPPPGPTADDQKRTDRLIDLTKELNQLPSGKPDDPFTDDKQKGRRYELHKEKEELEATQSKANEQRQEAEKKYAKDVEAYNKTKADYDKQHPTEERDVRIENAARAYGSVTNALARATKERAGLDPSSPAAKKLDATIKELEETRSKLGQSAGEDLPELSALYGEVDELEAEIEGFKRAETHEQELVTKHGDQLPGGKEYASWLESHEKTAERLRDERVQRIKWLRSHPTPPKKPAGAAT